MDNCILLKCDMLMINGQLCKSEYFINDKKVDIGDRGWNTNLPKNNDEFNSKLSRWLQLIKKLTRTNKVDELGSTNSKSKIKTIEKEIIY